MSIAVFLGLIFVLSYMLSSWGRRSTADNAIALEKNIRQAAVACYAIEGAYPQDIAYLVDHYGLIVDEKNYVVDYESVGSNIMPSILVAPKGTYYFENDWSK